MIMTMVGFGKLVKGTIKVLFLKGDAFFRKLVSAYFLLKICYNVQI